MLCFTVDNEESSLDIGTRDFAFFMELAQDYQWKPAGTEPCPDVVFYDGCPPWEREYMQQQGEIITKDDAAAWASSLEKALQVHAVGLGDTHSAVYHKAVEFLSFLRRGAFQVF